MDAVQDDRGDEAREPIVPNHSLRRGITVIARGVAPKQSRRWVSGVALLAGAPQMRHHADNQERSEHQNYGGLAP
jgi:hypothetical protein